MLKELLSDFSKVFFPKDLPETFEPYLSTILSIALFTFVIVGFQVAAGNIYAYSNNPSTVSADIQNELCKEFSQNSFTYICRNSRSTTETDQISSFSVEQDLHKLTN
jgi:hypothetical protein